MIKKEKMSTLKTKKEKPVIGIIANSISPANRWDLITELGEPDPDKGFFKPLKFSFKDVRGEIIALDIQPNEVLDKTGMIKAKHFMFNALEYLVAQGVKVVCFTASTKRLPGRFGQDVKKLYPNIIFSIGDTATMISYLTTIDYFAKDFRPEIDQVACLGAGFLGTISVKYLTDRGFKNVNLVTEQKLDGLGEHVKTFQALEDLPEKNVLFLSCSHKYDIDPKILQKKLAPGAVILDVAVPPGIKFEVFQSLNSGTKRFDTGDFFLEEIQYDFPSKILNFPAVGFWFGCFTEAVLLGLAIESGEDFSTRNFFEVTEDNLKLLRSLLVKEELSIPLINFYEPQNMKFFEFSG